MSLTLGSAPETLTVILVRDSDFRCTLESVTSDTDDTPLDWPAGTTITIVFGTDDEWAATITDNLAEWNVDATDVNDLIDAMTTTALRKAKLLYTADPDVEIDWAIGSVRISQ